MVLCGEVLCNKLFLDQCSTYLTGIIKYDYFDWLWHSKLSLLTFKLNLRSERLWNVLQQRGKKFIELDPSSSWISPTVTFVTTKHRCEAFRPKISLCIYVYVCAENAMLVSMLKVIYCNAFGQNIYRYIWLLVYRWLETTWPFEVSSICVFMEVVSEWSSKRSQKKITDNAMPCRWLQSHGKG